MNFDYKKHLILLALAGSRSYGTNRPDSDYDYRGVIIPPSEYMKGFLYTFEQKEGIEGYGKDSVGYDLRKFMKLAADCNPNIIETLFVDESFLVVNTKYGKKLREHKDLFLSKKARHTFSGYAFAQLKRIKQHKAWWDKEANGEIPLKPERKDFGLEPKPRYKKDILNNLISVPTEMLHPDHVNYIVAERKYFDQKKRYDSWNTWKVNRNPERYQLESKFNYDCYDEETEFLTDSGWKLFDEVSESDKLATVYIGKTNTTRTFGTIEYQNYLDRIDGTHNGVMYNFCGQTYNSMVTPNHRMLIRKVERVSGKKAHWKLDEAALMPDTFDVFNTIIPKKATFSNKDILPNDFPINLKQYLKLMGWYLSDGSMRFIKGFPAAIAISQKKGGRLCQAMTKFEKNHFGKNYFYDREPNGFNSNKITEQVLLVSNKIIADRMFNDCGSVKNKRIPRWVFGLSKRLMEILFDAMVSGDGTHRSHKTKKSNIIYYSSLKGLADDVNELALMAGWKTALWGSYQQEGVEMYQVFVDKNQEMFKTMIRSANVKKVLVKNKRIVCFTVPNGTLITRYKGNVSFHGNCKHAMHLVRLMNVCEEILTKGEVIVNRPDVDFLMSIRNGEKTYDWLISWAEEKEALLGELYETSDLQHKADMKKINDLCVELLEEAEKDGFPG